VAEPLVVQFRPEARQEFARRASRDPARRGRAAIALAVLLALLPAERIASRLPGR